MSLSQSQWRTLEAVCETLVPGGETSLPGLIVETLSTTGNPGDLAQFRQALTLLESPIAGLLLDGRRGRFSLLPLDAREAVLRRWANHPLPKLRQAFQAMKRLGAFLNFTAGNGAFFERLGYPGGDGSQAGEPLLRVAPYSGEGDLIADAVIVGSGAGGGVVAAELASRGLQVIILEKGGYFPEGELGRSELKGMQELYLDRGMTATRDLSVAIFAGSAVGGGTLVNWTASIAPPDWLRLEWEERYGLEGLTSPEFQQCVDDVWNRLHVNTSCSASLPNSSAGRLIEGCTKLGYHAAELPRNISGCGEDCGFCCFGCRTGAKQSTARTFLVDAVNQGARVIPQADVRRVLTQGGQTTGVEAVIGGRTVTVKAPRVIVAAGAIGTPALLLRSGLSNANIGRHLHLHPVVAVPGIYPEPVFPWSGRLLPAYSRQFQRLDGNYGFLLEVTPAHPGLAALASPWYSGEQYLADLSESARMAPFIVLVRDRGSGRVTIDREGRHRIDYALSPYDRHHLLLGQREAIRVHGAAGATKVRTLHASCEGAEGGRDAIEAFAERSTTLPSGPNRLPILSAHQMGTCRMGRSAREAVTDPTGQVYGVRGLYVADGSVFPSASGVNPMITIMSMARWIARQVR